MRLLIISDLAATGFGRVGRELAVGLLNRGHDVKCIGINWRGVDGELVAALKPGTIEEQAADVRRRIEQLQADPLTDRIVPAVRHGDAMGHNLSSPAIRGSLWSGWQPEGVIVVADPRAMWLRLVHDDGAFAEAKKRGVPCLNYVPIEGQNLPLDWELIWRFVEPVAMSSFGQERIAELVKRPVPLIHHGVSDAFYPVSPERPGEWRGKPVTSKDEAKAAVGLAGRTVLLRTDRYIYRKNYPALMRVLRPVLAAHPEAIAILHTVPYDDTGQGNLWQLMSREPGALPGGVAISGDMTWTHPQIRVTGWHDSWQGLPDAELNVLYNAADLLISPTMAEGFGLTLAEALSAEVPVVATNYSAVPEVVGDGGLLIDPAAFITSAYAVDWALVDEPAMSAAVERLVNDPVERRRLGEAGRHHVARFDWARAVEQFEQMLIAGAARPAAVPGVSAIA